MANSLVKALGELARERQTLREKERQLVRKERQTVDSLRRLLPRMGYRVVSIAGANHGKLKGMHSNGRAKRIPCPKCDRHFSHPLPLARHVSAMHRAKKAKGKAAKTST